MTSSQSVALSGILIIDKPAGWTSHDIVGRLRRLLGERRIGHAGTLDPAATGVLPVAVGQATRVIEFLEGATKSYQAEITFGVETDSYDADGTVTRIADPSMVDAATVESALGRMVGPTLQMPPMHSAIKIGGRRLYDSARQGIEVARPARTIEFFQLRLVDWTPPVASVFVDCSKGTYVRSLAFDLGRDLGPGAHLSNLVRLRAGPYALCEAWTIAEIGELAEEGRDVLEAGWPWMALHPDSALSDAPALILDDDDALALVQGRTVAASMIDGEGQALDTTAARAYDARGGWLGVVRRDPERAVWRPVKISA